MWAMLSLTPVVPSLAAEPVSATVAAGDDVSKLRAALSDTEARLRSLSDDNRRLNKEVKDSIITMGGLRHQIDLLRVRTAGEISGDVGKADQKRIAELETTLAEVRTSSDRLDTQARVQADDSRRVIEELTKRLEEGASEPARLRAQLAVSERALAIARNEAAVGKKRSQNP